MSLLGCNGRFGSFGKRRGYHVCRRNNLFRQGAKELFDLLEQRKAEIENLIRSVSGLQAYSLIRTDDGGVTVTVCQDKAVSEGSVVLQLS